MDILDYATRIKRLINFIIDTLLIIAVWFSTIPMIIKWLYETGLINWIDGKIYDLNFTIIPYILFYYLILEGFFKTSIGKLITRTKIIRMNGDKIKFSDAVIRTIFRFIPLEQLSYLSSFPVGWHDSISNTRVVNMNSKKF